MDLEVVGRHALFFDDDSMAAFVNCGDALVEWNSLQIDRYDVRHLLSAPLPPRRRRNPQTSSHHSDSSVESELDKERYLDLPPPSDEPEGEIQETEKPGDTGGYHSVAFSYGNGDDSAVQKHADGGLECSGFRPPFPVPESLLQSLPPTEKVHHIIARTAMFVSKHGGQSEIVLRVKQGDNLTFGFLMPDHHLHAYFRFLVNHHELLQAEVDGSTQSQDHMMKTNENSDGGGALSLLGSVYGSGEDEDCAIEDVCEVKSIALETSGRKSHDVEKTESISNADEKDITSKHPSTFNKDKAPVLKKNPLIAVSKSGSMSSMIKKDDSNSCSTSIEKSKESIMLEPPSDMKRLINKIVEFIVKNGKQFEATLREQDSNYGRFPFLLPSNAYHPYYQAVLQRALESKVSAKNSLYGKDDSAGRCLEKNAALSKDNGATSSGYVGSDLPYESDRKEKFKMIIGKSKDVQDPPSKATQQEYTISIDAAATAAILQAATRGIRNPNLGIISRIATMNGNSGCHGSEVAQVSSFQSQPSSQTDSIIQKTDEDGGCISPNPIVMLIAKAAVSETAGEADSHESHLTRELKLKAERLKRAKMFVAMLKSGAEPSTNESSRALSVEPSESGVLVAGSEVTLADKKREGSSAPVDVSILDKCENSGRKQFDDDYNERRSRRKYRSRSERHDEDDEDTDEEDAERNNSKKKQRSHGSSHENKDEREKDEYRERKHSKHSKKRHRSHRSSHEDDIEDQDRKDKSHKRSRKKHRSRHLSNEDNDGEKDAERSYHKESRKKHSSHRSSEEDADDGDYEDEKYQKHSRKKHRSHRSSHRSRDSHKRRKGDSSRDKESSLRSKYDTSSDTEHGQHRRYVEDKKESQSEKEELEEGEISSKVSDQSRGTVGGQVSREPSTDVISTLSGAASQPSGTTEVSDDLRAKIRAMLMATR